VHDHAHVEAVHQQQHLVADVGRARVQYQDARRTAQRVRRTLVSEAPDQEVEQVLYGLAARAVAHPAVAREVVADRVAQQPLARDAFEVGRLVVVELNRAHVAEPAPLVEVVQRGDGRINLHDVQRMLAAHGRCGRRCGQLCGVQAE